MAMGDFSPWTSSGSTTASTPAAVPATPAATTTQPGFFGTTTGAQNVTNALTGTATGATTGYSQGAAPASTAAINPNTGTPYTRSQLAWQEQGKTNPYHYDAWGQTPDQSFYGTNPHFWNFSGGGHNM